MRSRGVSRSNALVIRVPNSRRIRSRSGLAAARPSGTRSSTSYCSPSASVATDAEGEQYDVLERVPDGRAAANPERDLMRRELGTRITSALDRLTPRERMLFELKHYHGLKLRTVGEILHTTEETAKNTLFRATQKLRGALADMR